jgi:hypothetical protein
LADPIAPIPDVSCVVFHTVLQRCACDCRCFCRQPCCCQCRYDPRNPLPPRPQQLKVQRRTPSSPHLPLLPVLLLRVRLLLLRRRRRQARCPFHKWSSSRHRPGLLHRLWGSVRLRRRPHRLLPRLHDAQRCARGGQRHRRQSPRRNSRDRYPTWSRNRPRRPSPR